MVYWNKEGCNYEIWGTDGNHSERIVGMTNPIEPRLEISDRLFIAPTRIMKRSEQGICEETEQIIPARIFNLLDRTSEPFDLSAYKDKVFFTGGAGTSAIYQSAHTDPYSIRSLEGGKDTLVADEAFLPDGKPAGQVITPSGAHLVVAYFSLEDGKAHVRDLDDGEDRRLEGVSGGDPWSNGYHPPSSASAYIEGRYLAICADIFGNIKGATDELVVFDISQTPQEKLRISIENSDYLIRGNHLVVGTGGGRVIAIDIESGEGTDLDQGMGVPYGHCPDFPFEYPISRLGGAQFFQSMDTFYSTQLWRPDYFWRMEAEVIQDMEFLVTFKGVDLRQLD